MAVILSTVKLAEVFGCTRRIITTWGEKGCPRHARDAWDVKEVVQWWAENIYDADEGEDSDMSKARTRYWKANAEGKELQTAMLKGSVVKRDEIDTAWAWRISEISTGLMSFALRLAPQLEMKDELTIRKVITESVWKLLDNFSRTGKFMKKDKIE